MVRKHPVLSGVVIAGCIAGLGLVAAPNASDDQKPSSKQIAFAQEVSDLMLNELVAALFQEFNETTPQNVEHGKQAISLVFKRREPGYAPCRRLPSAPGRCQRPSR